MKNIYKSKTFLNRINDKIERRNRGNLSLIIAGAKQGYCAKAKWPSFVYENEGNLSGSPWDNAWNAAWICKSLP